MLNSKFYGFIQIIVDVLLIHAGYLIAFYIRYLGEFPEANFPSYIRLIPWISLLAILMFFIYGLYDTIYKRWIEIFSSILWVIGFIFAGNTALSFMLRQFAFPRTVLLMAVFVHVILLSFWRYWIWKMAKKTHGKKTVIIVGKRDEAEFLAGKINESTPDLYKVIGVVVTVDSILSEKKDHCFSILGEINSLESVLIENNPSVVFVCSDLSKEEKVEILSKCLEYDCDINFIPDFYDTLMAQAKILQVDDIPVLYVNSSILPSADRTAKRVMDIFVAVFGLLLTMPLFLIISLLIRLDSKGPIIFKQERVGRKGKIFFLYKFRTMVDNAEKSSGPVLSNLDDVRVTRIGKLLRHSRLDELPQFINVLKGI